MTSAHSRGFTTRELLVAVAVLAAVFLLLIPALNTWREKRNRAVCADNLRRIGVAIFAYAGDHQQFLPATYHNAGEAIWDTALLRGNYLVTGALRCPSDRYPRPFQQIPRTYALSAGRVGAHNVYWIQGSRLNCTALSNRAAVVIVGERLRDLSGWSFGVVGNHLGCYCDKDRLWSAHAAIQIPRPDEMVRIKASNYLFLDGHVAWMENLTDARLDEMFPANPGGTRPCP